MERDMTVDDETLLRHARNCVRSAADNFMEATVGDYELMGDLEVDLEAALKALKELIKRRNDRYDAEYLKGGEK
jgi:hypothetical protein